MNTRLSRSIRVCALALLMLPGCSSSDSGGDDGDNGSEGGQGGGDSGGQGGGDAKGGSGGSSKSGGSGGSSATGGSGGSGGGSAPTEVSIDDYPAAFAQAQCKQIWGCCEEQAKMTPQVAGKDMTVCLVLRSAGYRTNQNNVKMGATAGNLTYDGKKVAECTNRIAALKCDSSQADIEAAFAPCEFITPKVEVDGTCVSTTDCIDSYCDSATKKCTAKKADGAECKGNDECTNNNCKSMDGMKKCAPAEMVEPMMDEPGICGALF